MASAEQKRLASLLSLPENRFCADCHAPSPKWASFSLGYFVCIDCSGIHRAMGTHITKIKSTTLDAWTTPWVDLMARVGNVRFNAVYEAGLSDRRRKPGPAASMDERERFIRSKYERRQYYGAPSASSLRAAAEDAEMKFEALPPGYMEGVDTTQVAAAAGLADAGSAAVNPALARRLAKKAAEDEAVAAARRAEEAAAHKLKEDAELAARVAAEAERRAVDLNTRNAEAARLAASRASVAGLSDVFGAPAPAQHAGGFSFMGAPGGVVAPPTSNPNTASLGFGFLNAAASQPPSAPLPGGSGFGFVTAAPAPPAAGGFGFVGAPAIIAAPPQPTSGGFDFLSGAAAAGPATAAPVGPSPGSQFNFDPSPSPSTGGLFSHPVPSPSAGGLFAGLQPQVQQPLQVQPTTPIEAAPTPSLPPSSSFSFVVAPQPISAAPHASFGSMVGAVSAPTSGSSFSFVSGSATPLPHAPTGGASAAAAVDSAFADMTIMQHQAPPAPQPQLPPQPPPQQQQQAFPFQTPVPISSGGNAYRGVDSNAARSGSSSAAQMHNPISNFALPPTESASSTRPGSGGQGYINSVDVATAFSSANARSHAELAEQHAKTLADLAAEFAAKQAALGAAYTAAVGRLSESLRVGGASPTVNPLSIEQPAQVAPARPLGSSAWGGSGSFGPAFVGTPTVTMPFDQSQPQSLQQQPQVLQQALPQSQASGPSLLSDASASQAPSLPAPALWQPPSIAQQQQQQQLSQARQELPPIAAPAALPTVAPDLAVLGTGAVGAVAFMQQHAAPASSSGQYSPDIRYDGGSGGGSTGAAPYAAGGASASAAGSSMFSPSAAVASADSFRSSATNATSGMFAGLSSSSATTWQAPQATAPPAPLAVAPVAAPLPAYYGGDADDDVGPPPAPPEPAGDDDIVNANARAAAALFA